MEKKTKIGFVEKLTFFCANVGNIPVMTLISTYLLLFYTDVVGLSAAAVGTLFLITKILDGINDPLMGFIIDRMPRTKSGKFKTGLLIGSIICSINFIILWLGPALVPTAWKLIVAYVTYLLIGITFDIMDISLNSMIPAMTGNLKERSALSTIKGAGYMLGMVLVSVGAPLIISAYATKRQGFFVLIGVAAIAVLALSIVGAVGVKERVGALNEKSYSLRQMVAFLGIGPVLITFFSQLLFIAGKSVLTASEVFYATYIMGNLKIVSVCSIIMVAGMIPAIALTNLLVKKAGKRLIYSIGILVFCLGPLMRLLAPTNVTLMYLSYIAIGFGAGMVMVLMYGIQADNIDYVEYQKGIRAEGAISSLQSFVAKVGGAIGGAVPAFILSWSGYAANQQQTDTAVSGIIISTLIVPAVFCIAASLLFLLGYKLNQKQLEDTVASLEEMRAKKQVAE